MANKIILKKSSVAGKIPVGGDLSYGELALNYNDATLYYKRPDDSIDLLVNPDSLWKNLSTTVSTTSPTELDSWDSTVYRTAKYIVQISQGTDFQSSELLVLHNGTTTFNTEYAVIYSNGALATISTSYDAGSVKLLVTMLNSTSATINIKRTLTRV